jgi:Tfp pilus assembly protein PilO
MRIAKVVIVGVLVISLLCIGYIYFFKDEKEERASFVNKEKNLSEESQHFEKNIDDSSSSSKGKKIDVVAQHPALNMTGEQFDKIMKAGLENGVVYTSMNEFDDVTKNAIKQALENLNEKGSLSGGIKVK